VKLRVDPEALLPSRRPKFLMMPSSNADLLADTLLTALSVIEAQGFAYTAHQGTLLGAARLQGLLSWDVDADIGLLEGNAEKVQAGLERALDECGLALVFSSRAYYYTICPFIRIFGRRVLMFPMIEVILISTTIDPHTGDISHDRHSPCRMFGANFSPAPFIPGTRHSSPDQPIPNPCFDACGEGGQPAASPASAGAPQ
jgi:hypothetical protein